MVTEKGQRARSDRDQSEVRKKGQREWSDKKVRSKGQRVVRERGQKRGEVRGQRSKTIGEKRKDRCETRTTIRREEKVIKEAVYIALCIVKAGDS